MPTPPSEPSSHTASDPQLDELWSKVIDAVGRASPFTRSYLMEAHPVSLAKDILTIGYDPEFGDHLELVDNAKNRTLIQTKLKELGCGEVQVRFIKAESPQNRRRPEAPAVPNEVPAPPANLPTAAKEPRVRPATGGTEPIPFNKDEFKNDPLIQKALEVFKGQIVEVRA